MKPKAGFAIVLLSLASLVGFGEDGSDTYRNAQIVWEADKPTCYDKTLPLVDKLESLSRFIVGGEVTEPIAIDAPNPTIDDMEATGERPWFQLFEIVINKTGKTELVVSLKGGYPAMEDLMGRTFSKWTWQPSTIEDEPVCARYILTHRIEYQ